MEYAAYVESRNKDVITASAITAENDLRKSLDELRKKLSGEKYIVLSLKLIFNSKNELLLNLKINKIY